MRCRAVWVLFRFVRFYLVKVLLSEVKCIAVKVQFSCASKRRGEVMPSKV